MTCMWSSWCHCYHIVSTSVKLRMVYPSVQPTWIVHEKRPLNECCGWFDSFRGCHYLHQNKATCGTTPFLHNCRIFRPKMEVAPNVVEWLLVWNFHIDIVTCKHLWHPTASQHYELRHRTHSLHLPEHSTHLSDCSFSTRMLYKNTY